MLPTFVIGLREGVEASLIVGIVAAFLVREGRRDALRSMWVGVGLAVLLCVGVGVALGAVQQELAPRPREAFEGVLGLVAVVLVTSMIVWMRRHARTLRTGLEASARSALARGTATGLVLMAFLAVLREGFETSVFLLAQFNAAGGNAATGAVGAVLGIVVAAGLGYAIYRGGIRIDLGRFFTVTGVVLVLIAAGLVLNAIGSLNEAGLVTAGRAQAFDLSWLVRPGTLAAALLTGLLGLPSYPIVLQVLAWSAYLVPMLAVVLWPSRRRRSPAPLAPSTTSASASPAGTPPASTSSASAPAPTSASASV